MAEIAQILNGGGVLALSLVVWYELREFRKAAVGTLVGLATKQELILQKQNEIHPCPYSKERRRLEVLGANSSADY